MNFVMCFTIFNLRLDDLLESRIEIAIIQALGMTKWLVKFFMNIICHNLLEIVLWGGNNVLSKFFSDRLYETPFTDSR